MKDFSLKDWIPHHLIFGEREILCEWLYLSNKKFIEPFFKQTAFSCQNLAENKKLFRSISTFDGLIEAGFNAESIEPICFIFHISRCGSTLLTQMFSLNEKNIVVSEAEILHELAKYFFAYSDKKFDAVFQAVIKLLGKKRFANEENFFVKLDSWHIFFYEKLRSLFPKTPFIFTFRKPSEVIRSQINSFNVMVPFELFQFQTFGFEFPEFLALQQETYVAKVLERYFEEYLRISEIDENSLFLNYADGISSNLEKIESFLKISFENDIKEKMFERTKFHSKNPHAVFQEKNLTDELPIYQQRADDLYQELLKKLS